MSATATWDMRTWDNGRRKEVSIVVMLAAVVLVVSGLVLEFVLGTGQTVLNVLVGILVLLLLVEAAVHLAKPKASAADAGAAAPSPGAAGPVTSEAAHITLKCGQCATVFDVPDTGERPLYHTCPGCGAQGVLGAPAATTEAAPAAPARTPIRKLKLRCAACQTVFVIEDFGERPLRHACPGCGRKGELK